MTAPTFQRAQRAQVKLKALHIGPSGSGKTKGALAIATRLAPEKVALIDSENGRSSYYADEFVFDALLLDSHKPKAYQDAIDAAVAAGYGICVIDGLSHAWQDVLDRKEAYDRANPSSNSYTNWKIFGAEWEKLVRHILEAPIHIIATARSKQAYELVTDDRGKKRPEKLGLQPTIREGTEYEFALVFDILPSHKARATKDNLGIFGEEESLWDLCDPKVSASLAAWLASGKPFVTPPVPSIMAESLAPARLTRESIWDRGKLGGQAVKDLPMTFLEWATEPGRKLGDRGEEWVALFVQEIAWRASAGDEADENLFGEPTPASLEEGRTGDVAPSESVTHFPFGPADQMDSGIAAPDQGTRDSRATFFGAQFKMTIEEMQAAVGAAV